MKLTKYAHACLVLEEQGQKLVIDPGGWTDNFGPLDNIATVVVTHNHFDHFDADKLHAIVRANPNVKIFCTPEVATEAADLPVMSVTSGQSAQAGPFTLRFFGEMHAPIHASFPPVPHNTGVLVNDNLYYPGDSFTIPDTPVKTLAVPVSAPWLKIAEVIDFVTAIKPQVCVPTHTIILSEQGQTLADAQMGTVCKSIGATYHSLKPSESLEI